MHEETLMKIKWLSMTCAMALLPLAAQAELNPMSEPALAEIQGQALSINMSRGPSFSLDTVAHTASLSHGSVLDVNATGTIYGYGYNVQNLGWNRTRGFSLGWTPPVVP
jgi:hypothetical protein